MIKDAVADAAIELALGGDIHVSGVNSAGVFIADRAGGVSQMEITGRITATGAATNAIEVADHAAALRLPLILSGDAVITGDIISRGGADDFRFKDNARVEGDVNLGGGDDSLTLSDNAMIRGDVDLGKGDDTLTLIGKAQFSGKVDGGEGHDTFDGLLWTHKIASRYNTDAARAARSREMNLVRFEEFKFPEKEPDVKVDPSKEPLDVVAEVVVEPDVVDVGVPVITGTTAEGVTVFSIVDLSGQSAQAAYVGVIPVAINQVVNQRFSGGADSMASRQHASARPVMVAATELLPGTLFRGRSPLVWGSFFGSGRERGKDGQVLAYTQRSFGGVFGIEQQYGGRHYLGGLFGYARSDFSTDIVSVKADTDTFFGGVYGRAEVFDGLTLGASLTGGAEGNKNKRFIDSDTLISAQGDYNSYFLSPSLGLSTAVPVGSLFEWRPSAQLNYTIAWYDSYTESGPSNSNLALEDRKASNLQARVELAGAFLLEQGEFSLRGGLKSRFGDGDDIAGRAVALSRSFRFTTPGRDNVHSAFVGASLRYSVLDGLAVQADFDYTNAAFGRVNEKELSGQMLVEYRF